MLPPLGSEAGGARVLAALRVRTPVPTRNDISVGTPAERDALNRRATLSALYVEDGTPCIGSRVTLYEDANAWELLAPLVLASVSNGAASMLDACTRRAVRGRLPAGAGSAWTSAEFTQAERLLSRLATCAAGARDFTAEFALRVETSGARAGTRACALWRLCADEAHAGVGAGLACRLELPHAFDDETQALRAAERLNALEMSARDLPPHFGAWSGANSRLAYVTFLPNELHPLPRLTVNLSVWARARALWAQRRLRARRRPR